MKQICLCLIVIMMVASAKSISALDENKIEWGNFSVKVINDLLAKEFTNKSDKIERISGVFKGIPYNDKTLIGSSDETEVFVINLKEVDCFTFIDYVEALSRSRDFDDFQSNLKVVRYRDGIVDFRNRRHFFTDWAYDKDAHSKDVTKLIAGDKVITTKKRLNLKKSRRFYLDGFPVIQRNIIYIPSRFIDKRILDGLKTGDYIGIYSNEAGLDVSHVGIFIRDKDGKILFRHASSIKGKVVDQSFINYVKNRPGIVVLRTTE
ncbi:MAG: DUF1460 domain-containing protein [Thermodesulfovibrionales bacterium]|nr:DUF1460 domain-containing protein [Thermodesulfovibrionales bacterium]